MDIPQCDETCIIRNIKEAQGQESPAISITTNRFDPNAVNNVKELGAIDVMRKPMYPVEVRKTLASYL